MNENCGRVADLFSNEEINVGIGNDNSRKNKKRKKGTMQKRNLQRKEKCPSMTLTKNCI